MTKISVLNQKDLQGFFLDKNDLLPFGKFTKIYLLWRKQASLRKVILGNFHQKALKWVKNQAKGSKIHEIRTKQPI